MCTLLRRASPAVSQGDTDLVKALVFKASDEKIDEGKAEVTKHIRLPDCGIN